MKFFRPWPGMLYILITALLFGIWGIEGAFMASGQERKVLWHHAACQLGMVRIVDREPTALVFCPGHDGAIPIDEGKTAVINFVLYVLPQHRETVRPTYDETFACTQSFLIWSEKIILSCDPPEMGG